jgi:cell division protein FtsI (penicillin-binding protein 3)
MDGSKPSISFFRKKMLKLVRYLIFWILVFRIFLLKIKHYSVKKVKRNSKKLTLSPKILKDRVKLNQNIFKQVFIWDLSENTIKIRLVLVIVGFLLVFGVLSIKLIFVASVDLITTNKFLGRDDMFRRDIVDRYGNLLAVNLPIASLYAKPKKIVDSEILAQKLVRVFPELEKRKILELLNIDKNFVWIKRDISPKQQEDIYNLGIPGLEFEREQKRIYTYGNLLSHVVGYVGRDMEGLAGIEKFFDKMLTTQDEDNYSGNSNLQLSIDVRVQNILAEEIDKTLKKFHAKGAAGIVVDPNNGEIIAMVSKPDFDPHYPGNALGDQLFNMVTQGVYEMGSGMKALTLAIGLDTGIVNMNDAYDLSYMKVGKFKVKDYHPVKGWHSIGQIFLHSSNIGVSQIMLEIGKNNLRNYLKKLKLLEKIEIELPERARPLFPPYSRWSDLSLVTMSYGYAISESPAHFIQAMMPLVNGGFMYPLTLLKRKENIPIVGEKIFKETTSKYMRQLMRLVVKEGTGKKAEVNGYYVGGKTGTAEKVIGGKYYKDKRISSFFGIMPATNPKYIIYIIFDEPQGIKETYNFAGGGWTAAPTVGAVLERIAVLYGMNKLDETDSDVQELTDIDYIIDGKT